MLSKISKGPNSESAMQTWVPHSFERFGEVDCFPNSESAMQTWVPRRPDWGRPSDNGTGLSELKSRKQVVFPAITVYLWCPDGTVCPETVRIMKDSMRAKPSLQTLLA